ncbi:hypothetical protein [Haloarchaeobius sp. TZWSO28]|uniref:hypothetical protein n=1 Tax=Haloarchaeobius sp. TZWSO28 TaxID=3446119 RepID=UPI003EB72CC8
MKIVRVGVVLLVLCLLAVPVLAHVPSFPVDNTSPERAVEVPDAVKSWSFYDRLDGGGAKYYRFSLDAGERLQVSTFTPRDGEFTPSIVVMSPSLDGTEGVPAGVTVPDGMGAVVVEGERPAQPGYEPFAPSANYQTAELSRPVESQTTYLVAIYEPENRSGPAGVALGYSEEFSPVEYLTVPFDLVQTHLWEGKHPLVVLGPFMLTVLVGLNLVWERRGRDWLQTPALVLLAAAGLVLVGTGVNTLVQMGLALWHTGPTAGAVVTAIFVVVPVVCGLWAVRLALRTDGTVAVGTRLGLAVAGVLSLVTWGGFIVGPVVLLGMALAPARLVEA